MIHLNYLPVADGHADVLMKLAQDSRLSFYGQTNLQASAENLTQGNVKTQVFAIFVSPTLPNDAQLRAVLQQIDVFYQKVIQSNFLNIVTNHQSLRAARDADCIAGLLSLEGAACLGRDLNIIHVLHQLGVRGVGLTWNGSNDLADGCHEPRGGGLTQAGKNVVRELKILSMWIDIAHLSNQGVYDIFQETNGIVMASHANCRSVYNHARNLTDETIKELIRRNGWLGLTFEASFLGSDNISQEHVLQQIDHVLSLGGSLNVGFGSDFDGTTNKVFGLGSAADYTHFAELLVQRYGTPLARGLLFENFESFLLRQLPEMMK